MKNRFSITSLIVFLFTILGSCINIEAYTSPKYIDVNANILKHRLIPNTELEPNQPFTLELSFTPLLLCNENVHASLSRRDNYNSLKGRNLELNLVSIEENESVEYSTVIEETISKNDTVNLQLTLECDKYKYTFDYYLYVSKGKVRYSIIDPRTIKPKQPSYDSPYPIRDTLTEEQLKKLYTVGIDLREKENYDKAKSIIGFIPDSCKSEKYPGYYFMQLPFEVMLNLGDKGIELNQVGWETKLWKKMNEDSLKQAQPK